MKKKMIGRSLIVFVFVAALVTLSEAQKAAKNKDKSSGPTSSATMPMLMPIVAPLFLEGGHFSSTITAVNDTLQATKITVILYDRAGGTLATVDKELGPHSQQAFAVADLLQSAGDESSDRRTVGSVEIVPEMVPVAAQLSLTYSQSKMLWHTEEEFAMPSTSPAVYRGVAVNSVGSPFVALKSTSKRSLRVTVQCVPEKDTARSQDLILAPQELKFIPACAATGTEEHNFVETSLDTERNGAGSAGVSISSDGTEEELSVYGMGWSRFKRAKKLTSIFFVNPNELRSSETAYTGVAIGVTKTLGGDNYSPLLTLTNFSEGSASVTITSASTQDMGLPKTENQHIEIPAMSTATVPLDPSNADIFLRNSVLVQSTLPPGAVVTKLISVGGANGPILEYQPKDTQQKQNGGLHPWTVAEGQESTLFLFNYTPSDQYFNVRLYANGTTWQEALLLKAMETRNLQIDQVINGQMADDKGTRLPKNAESGEASWSTPGKFKGIGRMLVSKAGTLARNFSCGQCLELCSASLNPFSSLSITVDGFGGLGDAVPTNCVDPDCACMGFLSGGAGNGFSFSWTSSLPGIATISGTTTSSSATFRGVGVGQGDGQVDVSDGSCDVLADGPINVAPQVHFSALKGIARGATGSVQVTFTDQNGNSLSSSPFTITLSLSTDANTSGGATFDDGTTSKQITAPLTVTLKGTTTSSTADNIKLDAKLSDGTSVATPALKFSVIWVMLSFRNTGNYTDDPDDSAAEAYSNQQGNELGNSRPGQNNIVIQGTVTPSNFSDAIPIKRKITSAATYNDTSNGSTLEANKASPSGTYTCASTDQTQCFDDSGSRDDGNQVSTPTSSGHIYDLDSPAAIANINLASDVDRQRANFVEFASYGVCGQSPCPASALLTWYSRSSACIRNNPNTVTFCSNSGVNKEIDGDDQSASGTTTKISFDLK